MAIKKQKQSKRGSTMLEQGRRKPRIISNQNHECEPDRILMEGEEKPQRSWARPGGSRLLGGKTNERSH